jgi:hypothetical protein
MYITRDTLRNFTIEAPELKRVIAAPRLPHRQGNGFKKTTAKCHTDAVATH